MYVLVFAQLSLHEGKREFSSKPAPLHKAVEHQENTRLTLVLAGVMFTDTHMHTRIRTHTHMGKRSPVTLKRVTLNYLNDQTESEKRGRER